MDFKAFDLILSIEISKLVHSPNGQIDPKSTCNCSEAPGWVAGKWLDPWCHEGKCFSGIKYDGCKEKPNGHPLGDGTWCYEGRRDTECLAVNCKEIYFDSFLYFLYTIF